MTTLNSIGIDSAEYCRGEWVQVDLCPKNYYGFQFPCEKVKIEDIEAWRSIVVSSETNPTDPVAPNTIHLSFVHNGKHYRWTGYFNNQSKEAVIKVFDELTSSFKFIEYK